MNELLNTGTMKHKSLFRKATVFCLVAIASIIGVALSQSIEFISLFIFTTGLSLGVAAVYVTEIIKKTKI